jgi:DNA polymerase I
MLETNLLLQTFRQLLKDHNIQLLMNTRPANGLANELVSLDVEHDESGGFVGCGILVMGSSRVYYFSDLLLLSRIDFSTISIVAHNGISDLECLRSWGIDVKDDQLVWDTMLMGHIIDSSARTYGLKDMAERILQISYPSYNDIVGKETKKQAKPRITLDKQPEELVAMYNAMDVWCTAKIYDVQADTNNPYPGISDYFEDIERPISIIFNKMSNRGVRVDLSYLETLGQSLEKQRRTIEREIKSELGDINLNSPKQLLGALNAKEIFPVFKGKPSTDKRALEGFREVRVVQEILKYGELETLLSSFVRPYLERGQEVVGDDSRDSFIVHPHFNPCGTRTGRLSCSNPNLLQIPRRTENGKLVRRMFIPREGMLLGDCDFGQIEPRVLAHLSKDPALCNLFNDGIDFHAYTAERLGIDRDRAKVLNLSVGYRATFKSVMSQLRCTENEAQQQINSWWGLFPHLRRWQDELIYTSARSGFCETLCGRRIKVEGLQERFRWKREAAERQLINNITQGSAAEIMKMAMIRIQNTNPMIGLLVQVYDELVFEEDGATIADCVDCVKHHMENAVKLDVPLTVDAGYGENWAGAKA